MQTIFNFMKNPYEIGQWVDIKDQKNEWIEGQIIGKNENLL